MAAYRKIEVIGTSKESFADAVREAVAEAAKSVKNASWFEVVEQRGAVKSGKVAEFQVTVRIGHKVE